MIPARHATTRFQVQVLSSSCHTNIWPTAIRTSLDFNIIPVRPCSLSKKENNTRIICLYNVHRVYLPDIETALKVLIEFVQTTSNLLSISSANCAVELVRYHAISPSFGCIRDCVSGQFLFFLSAKEQLELMFIIVHVSNTVESFFIRNNQGLFRVWII